MKTAIVYYSAHHGNTKKLLDAIAESNDVTLIDITKDKTVDIPHRGRDKRCGSFLRRNV